MSRKPGQISLNSRITAQRKGVMPDHRPIDYGNQLARKENLTPEANNRRLQALMRGWATAKRKRRGEKVVIATKQRDKKAKKRIKLQETIIKEAREIQDAARTRTLAAIERLAQIVESETSKDSDAIAASIALLDRAYGKASQTNINANLDANGKHTDVTGKELTARIEAALKRVADLTGGKGEAPKGEKRPADIRERDRDTGDSTVH